MVITFSVVITFSGDTVPAILSDYHCVLYVKFVSVHVGCVFVFRRFFSETLRKARQDKNRLRELANKLS